MTPEDLVGKRVRVDGGWLVTVVSIMYRDHAGREGPGICVVRYDDFPATTGMVLASVVEKLPDERGAKL